MSGARTWRTLHLAVDPSTGEILASELTSNEDGGCDGRPVHQAVSERQPDPPVAVVIPPRSTAVPSPAAGTTPSQRGRHIQVIGDKVSCAPKPVIPSTRAREAAR